MSLFNEFLEAYPKTTLAVCYSLWAIAVVSLFCMLVGCA